MVVNLQNLEAIYRALSGGNISKARDLFDQSWQNCMQQSSNLIFAKRFAWEMILSLMQLLARDGINARDIVMGTDPLSLVSALEKRQEVYDLLDDFMENIYLYQGSAAISRIPNSPTSVRRWSPAMGIRI